MCRTINDPLACDLQRAPGARSGPAVGDLSPAIPTAGVALSLLLSAAQVLPQRAPAGLVRIMVLVYRLVANLKGNRDLISGPLHFK